MTSLLLVGAAVVQQQIALYLLQRLVTIQEWPYLSILCNRDETLLQKDVRKLRSIPGKHYQV